MKSKIKNILFIFIMIFIGISNTACGENIITSDDVKLNNEIFSTDLTEQELEAIGIQEGTVFNYGSTNDFTAQLPYLNMVSSFISLQLYDTLFYFEDGDTNKITGLLAKEWEMDEDGLGYTVELYDNITFSTGENVTAQTCIDCWETTKQYMPSLFSNIESIEAIGKYTLKFEFSQPFPTFMETFADTITSIVDPDMIEEYGASNNEAAVGTGPYYIENYVAGQVLTLKANKNYWNSEKYPHIETINIYYMSDSDTALISLENGDIDMYETSDVQVFYSMSAIDNMEVSTLDTQALPLWFNESHNEYLGIPEVREALGYLVDWQAVCDIVYDGYYSPLTSIWKEGTGAYVENQYFDYDVEKGLELLESVDVDSEDIEISILSYSKYKDAWTVIQSQLYQYGITVNIETYESATVSSIQASGDWDITASWVGYTPANPFNGFAQGIQSDASSKVIFFDEEVISNEIQSLYEKANSALDIDTQMNFLQEITTVLQDNFASLGGLQLERFIGVNSNFSNLVYDKNTFYIQFCYMYYEEE